MCSCVAWGFCDPQIRTLCWCTLPETWKVISSEKKIVDMKSGSALRWSSIVLANSTHLGLSFGSRRCINCTLYAFSLRRLWTIHCSVDFVIWSFSKALLNDFQGLRSYVAWTFATISSDVLQPPPCFLKKVPVAKNISCHFFRLLAVGVLYLKTHWNSLWTL